MLALNAYHFTLDVSTNATVCVVCLCACFAYIAYISPKRHTQRSEHDV